MTEPPPASAPAAAEALAGADPPACAPAPRLELLFEIDADAVAEIRADAGKGSEVRTRAWLPDHAFVLDWTAHALGATVPGGAAETRHELSVRLVSSATMRTLNRDWRGRDAPTNVLSFPSAMPPLAVSESVPDEGRRDASPALLALGDLALCPAVIAREAAAQGKPPRDHWAHLLVHGVLHLRGLDHVDAAAADAMERLEIRLLSMRDIPDPYGARPSPP